MIDKRTRLAGAPEAALELERLAQERGLEIGDLAASGSSSSTQRQTEELQAQQEELRVSNEELEEQSCALEESQVRLGEQALERQRDEVFWAQQELVAKAEELTRANRYKSEFLANMSHEMRTPLNSALILAKLLADNRDGNLSDEQVGYAGAI